MARTVRTLAEGIHFGEGPRWRDGRLWFSDFYAHAVKSVSLAGDVRTEFELDDQPSGLGWAPDGSLLVVSMIKRRVLRRAPDGTMSLHADLADIATWHCNDMVVDAAGGAYVGNFGFDLDAAMAAQDLSALSDPPKARLARIAPTGEVGVAAEDMSFPNGSVITPDGGTFIIGESFGMRLTAFDIGPGGGLSNRRIWASTAPRAPDGSCLDAEGAIWFANALAPECVRMAQGGEVLEIVETGDNCFACMLGGEDGRTLFMLTAPSSGADVATTPRGKILITKVEAPHAGLP
jgi:sugar lactone lactonase YvrE